jgi:hypothetical protein
MIINSNSNVDDNNTLRESSSITNAIDSVALFNFMAIPLDALEQLLAIKNLLVSNA